MCNQSEKNMPEAVIQQLNLSYNAEQDRLLLRVGLTDNAELLVWLTYRVTRALWQVLSEETHIPITSSIQLQTPPQQVVAKFKQEAEHIDLLQKMDFATAYQPRKEVIHNSAILANDALLIKDTDNSLVLEMPCIEGLNVRMNLTPELILALSNMLQLSAKEASWNIVTSHKTELQITMTPETSDKKMLH